MADSLMGQLFSSTIAGPTLVTDIITQNKKPIIILLIIGAIALLLKWWQDVNKKLK
ncbi:MAG: hypothetical protein WC438_02985 [Candidatus Pacearchaeota archaeon]